MMSLSHLSLAQSILCVLSKKLCNWYPNSPPNVLGCKLIVLLFSPITACGVSISPYLSVCLYLHMSRELSWNNFLLGIADPKDRDRIHSLSRKASYSMKAIPRGKAIIINNKCFFGRLGERKGTDEDATALVRLFQWLMFEVKRLNDQKSFEIQGALKKLADEDHSKYDCVIVAILSHGMDGGIYGTDDKAVSVEELTGYFKSSHSLAGKPKLFFLQACRGTTMDQGIAMDGLDAPDAEKFIQEVLAEDEADAKLASAIPSDADFLLSYATTPGFVSWRHQAKGSWYIQALVEVFERYACKEDLMSMLTMVNDKVAKDFQSMYGAQSVKQMPGPVTMLTKKLFFRPPE